MNRSETPTTNHITKRFTEADYREQHRERRKAILKANPEVKKMFGFDRRTIMVTALVNTVHIGLAYLLGRFLIVNSAWTVALLALTSFFVGAVLSHWLAMSIHECAHNLAAKKPLTNRLVSIFAGLGTLAPGAMTFHRYHIDHHTYLGVEDRDTDLAQKFEFGLVGNSTWRKALTLFFFPALYLLRGLTFMKKPDRWELANLFIQVCFNVALYVAVGPVGLVYLFLSLWFGHGIHPVAAHFVHEHYLFDGSQETYSYYGVLNAVTFNVGYHYEHHDLMDIPGWHLPKLRAMIPEYYDGLISHRSWTWVLWHYVTSPAMGPYTRRVRHVRTHRMEASAASSPKARITPHGFVHRALIPVCCLAFWLLTGSTTVLAQEPPRVHLIEDRVLTLTADEAARLAAIQTQSDWVTAMYLGGAGGLIVGLGLAFFAPFFAFSGGSTGAGLLGFGASTFLLGLVSLGIGIGLDVDVGSRRGGLERQIRTRVGLASLSAEVSF